MAGAGGVQGEGFVQKGDTPPPGRSGRGPTWLGAGAVPSPLTLRELRDLVPSSVKWGCAGQDQRRDAAVTNSPGSHGRWPPPWSYAPQAGSGGGALPSMPSSGTQTDGATPPQQGREMPPGPAQRPREANWVRITGVEEKRLIAELHTHHRALTLKFKNDDSVPISQVRKLRRGEMGPGSRGSKEQEAGGTPPLWGDTAVRAVLRPPVLSCGLSGPSSPHPHRHPFHPPLPQPQPRNVTQLLHRGCSSAGPGPAGEGGSLGSSDK